MTVPGHSPIYEDEERFHMRALWRLGLWAIAAAVAVGLVVAAGYSDAGTQRVRLAWAGVKAPLDGTRGLPPATFERPADTDNETRRLAQQVRALSADRERLIARLDALEKSFEDVTGSIARQPGAPPTQPEAARTAPDIGWAASVAQPGTLNEQPDWPAAARPGSAVVSAVVPIVENVPAPAAAALTRTEFGVDIGGGSTVSAMRALWMSIRSSHPTLLEGLRPVLTVRDGPRGVAELRLIAGPLVNAGAAARLCGSLGAAGLTCQPAVFEGQRLALR
jgi:hypothetical protein